MSWSSVATGPQRKRQEQLKNLPTRTPPPRYAAATCLGGAGWRWGVLAVSACHNFPPVQTVCKLERSPLQALGVCRTGAGLASLSWVPKGGDLALPQPSNLPLPAALQPSLSSGGLATWGMAGGASMRIDYGQAFEATSHTPRSVVPERESRNVLWSVPNLGPRFPTQYWP